MSLFLISEPLSDVIIDALSHTEPRWIQGGGSQMDILPPGVRKYRKNS
jgi:hypothetical protein